MPTKSRSKRSRISTKSRKRSRSKKRVAISIILLFAICIGVFIILRIFNIWPFTTSSPITPPPPTSVTPIGGYCFPKKPANATLCPPALNYKDCTKMTDPDDGNPACVWSATPPADGAR